MEVDGRCPDDSSLAGSIVIIGELAGRIGISGSFFDGASIEVGAMGENAAVTIDYDGWHDGDDWEDGAVIVIGEIAYENDTEGVNTLDTRLWEVSPCVADMNNDHAIDILDINPFILAVAGGTDYEEAWPGLGHWNGDDDFVANALFHADVNCDGHVNISDVNPFADRVSAGCCQPTCGECPGDGSSGGPGEDAEAIAVWWLDNVATENEAALRAVAAAMVDYYQDQPEAEAWMLILEALSE
ncbi:hypothetical protein RAS1_35420 [Phycisphaerae bacterium RAS1]|nr:hypothetical protein RAS1_35420 [Phycisphaerae bacterium RAS1]